MFAVLAVATSARDFPNDELFRQLDSPPQVSEEEAQMAEQMKQGLISLFGMEPIHVGQIDNQTEKKQKHGRDVQYDLGGLGWDYALLQVNENNFGFSQIASIQVALSW